MSRLEKTLQRKYKKRKLRIIMKVLFVLLMFMNLSICVLIVDKCAKDMLGYESYKLNSMLNEENIKSLNELKIKIINQIENFKNKA